VCIGLRASCRVLCRRHECLRDIEYVLDWVSGPARTAFKIFGSKEGRAGLRYASALRRALAAYQNLHPRIKPWFSITEAAYIVGQPTPLHREIAKAEAILDRPSLRPPTAAVVRRRMRPAGDRASSSSPATRRGGSQPTSPSCRSCSSPPHFDFPCSRMAGS
jgi:hypothetical protein